MPPGPSRKRSNHGQRWAPQATPLPLRESRPLEASTASGDGSVYPPFSFKKENGESHFLRNEKARAETKNMKSQAGLRKRTEKKEGALRLIFEGLYQRTRMYGKLDELSDAR